MELWIRSQDREKLVKVNYFYITKVDENHFNIVGETVDSGPRIGTYKTKERALEVLDEIVDLMLPVKEGLDENGEYSCKGCFANKDMMYYEMPLE